MKNLREFLIFDCDSFFKDKELCYLSHSHWHEYVDGKKTDVVFGTVIDILIAEDNTVYKKENVNNSFEKIKVKIPLSYDDVSKMKLEMLQSIKLKGLVGKVYGTYSENLSLTAEGIEIVDAKKN